MGLGLPPAVTALRIAGLEQPASRWFLETLPEKEFVRQASVQQTLAQGSAVTKVRRPQGCREPQSDAWDDANSRRMCQMLASFDQFAFPNSQLPFHRFCRTRRNLIAG